MIEHVKPYLKAAVAFIATLVTNIVYNLSQEGAVFPQDAKGWWILVGSTFLTTISTYGIPNKPLPKQVDKYLEEEGLEAQPIPGVKRPRRRPVI